MWIGVRDATRRLLDRFPAALARAGIVERGPATEAFDLAVPVMVTGGLRVLLRMADFVFVGLAIDDTAIAALELAFLYYFVAFGLGTPAVFLAILGDFYSGAWKAVARAAGVGASDTVGEAGDVWFFVAAGRSAGYEYRNEGRSRDCRRLGAAGGPARRQPRVRVVSATAGRGRPRRCSSGSVPGSARDPRCRCRWRR